MAEQVEWVSRPRPPRRLVDFQVTKQHRRFVEFADAVRRHRYIGACYGAPGLGKTLSARTYAAADDYDEWERGRYSRGTVLPDSLIDSRTLFYTPLVHVRPPVEPRGRPVFPLAERRHQPSPEPELPT